MIIKQNFKLWICSGVIFILGFSIYRYFFRTFTWKSGTDLNGPNERITIEIPINGKFANSFKVEIKYSGGGEGWMIFMNRGGPMFAYLLKIAEEPETTKTEFFIDPAYVNKNGFQNVTVRGQAAMEGLHLYSIKVQPIFSKIPIIPTVTPLPTVSSSPTSIPDDISNWKIYTNQEYRYNVKYPSTWYPSQTEVKTATSKDTVGFWPETLERETQGIWVTVRDDTFSYTDLNSWWIEYKKGLLTPLDVSTIEEKKALEENFDEWIEVKNITIAEQPALKTETKSGYPSTPYRSAFVIDNNNEIIEIYTNIADPKNPQFQVFDQVLSTFEFID